MAKNIGTFTAAGVQLEPAVASIKGIANLAALSGSSAEQASTAMYQLSQAISSGRVSLQDWNSVVNAGMGGATFQRALVTTAKTMGTVAEGAVKIDKATGKATINGQSFRESITARPGEKSWLTSDVLTSTLQQFTGDLSAAELKAQGFNDAQIKAIMKTAETAKLAATEVKTLKGVFDVAKESMGSGWAATFQIIFGNFEEAKKTFTDLSQAIQGMIGNAAKARNEILTEWKKLGGRGELIKGIKAAFEALLSVLKPVKEAFRDIFPRKTGQDLYELTVRFREFMEGLKIGPETADNLKRTFRGLFAALHIGWTVVKTIADAIFDLLGIVGDGSGGFLAFTGSVGDFITALDKAIGKGEGFQDVFDELAQSLEGPRKVLENISKLIKGLFDGGDSGNAASQFDALKDSLGPLAPILDGVNRAWNEFKDTLDQVVEVVAPIVEKVHDVFAKVGDAIVSGLKSVNYEDVMTFIQTTFLGGIAIGVKKLLKGIGLDLTGGALDNFKEVTGTLTKTLTAIQNNVNARTMLMIAGAVLALAGAAIIFSQVDAKKLGKAMAGITVGIAQLSGAMLVLARMGGGAAFLTLPFIAAGMVLLAGALILLGGAVHIFARLSWEDLGKGLLGVAGALTAVGAATKLMGPGLLLTGPALIAVAVAMNLLAVAMAVFGNMDWGTIIKGMIGMAGALVVIGAATAGLGPSLLLTGPGLILLSTGLILLSGALKAFGGMSLWEMAKGLVALGGSLLVIGGAISGIPPTIALQAAGLVILAVALNGIAVAMGIFGSMNLGTIIKGLATMGATLVVFAVGLTAMSGTLPGSVALLAAAAAFAILTPSLVVLGSLKWSTILKGLAAIAGTLLVLAGVGALAAGPLTALGIALVVIGGSVLLVSSGIYILAKAFALLGDKGTQGVSVMITAITALIALIPSMVINFVKGIADILEQLVKLAPVIATNLVKIIGTFLVALEALIPKAASAIGKLLVGIAQIISENAGPLIKAGWTLLRNILQGVADNIGQVTTQVGNIVVGFLNALAANAPRLIAAGARFLVSWLNGIANKLGGVIKAAANVVSKFLAGVAKELPRVYAQGVKLITRFLGAIANALPKVLASGVRIITKFLSGIANAIPKIAASVTRVITAFLKALGNNLPKIVDAGFKMVIRLMNGIARAIRTNRQQMVDAGWNLGSAIIDGILKSLTQLAGKVAEAAGNLAKKIPGKIIDVLGIGSPSKVMIELGEYVVLGLAKGLQDNTAEKAAGTTANAIVTATKKTLSAIPSLLGNIDANPVITPVLDLTLLKKNAGEYNRLVNPNVTPITAARSLRLASTAAPQPLPEAETGHGGAAGMVFKYEQHNTSPKALSTLEIYRQTKNQLSQVKGALGMATK
jgi:tape measure domain-containing protein